MKIEMSSIESPYGISISSTTLHFQALNLIKSTCLCLKFVLKCKNSSVSNLVIGNYIAT